MTEDELKRVALQWAYGQGGWKGWDVLLAAIKTYADVLRGERIEAAMLTIAGLRREVERKYADHEIAERQLAQRGIEMQKLEERIPLLEAKAAVCDAYLVARPDKDVSVEVWRAVNALRELQEKKQ